MCFWEGWLGMEEMCGAVWFGLAQWILFLAC